jgi:hypothetical protein
MKKRENAKFYKKTIYNGNTRYYNIRNMNSPTFLEKGLVTSKVETGLQLQII